MTDRLFRCSLVVLLVVPALLVFAVAVAWATGWSVLGSFCWTVGAAALLVAVHRINGAGR